MGKTVQGRDENRGKAWTTKGSETFYGVMVHETKVEGEAVAIRKRVIRITLTFE